MNTKITFVGLLLAICVAFIFFIKIPTPLAQPSSISTMTPAVASSTKNVATKEIEINFIAGAKNYSLSVPVGSTVYDAMNMLASSTNFSFSATLYSGLGYFVDEINGIKNQNGSYWTLYVNGTYSNVGASTYVLRNGDIIDWKYQK